MRGHFMQDKFSAPQKWAKFEVNGLDWQCYLAGSSKRAPRIFIFKIVLGAENLSHIKFIETHVRPFLAIIILSIGTVYRFNQNVWENLNFEKYPYHQIGYIIITMQHFPVFGFT